MEKAADGIGAAITSPKGRERDAQDHGIDT
jgi:hypothetical protein